MWLCEGMNLTNPFRVLFTESSVQVHELSLSWSDFLHWLLPWMLVHENREKCSLWVEHVPWSYKGTHDLMTFFYQQLSRKLPKFYFWLWVLVWIVKNNKTWHELPANQNRSEHFFLVLQRFIMQCHTATVPFIVFCCSLLLVRYGFLLISGYKIKTVMYYSSEYYTHWWLWLLKFRTTSSHTNMPQCHPRGPLCLVWRALTPGLWPLPEATPLSALLLLEDHTLFILLDSCLFSAFLLLCSNVGWSWAWI